MFGINPNAYNIYSDGEKTPELHRRFEPEEKEPNVPIDTGSEIGACYLCNRGTNVVIVFSPYPQQKQSDAMVKSYRIRICGWCAVAHKIIPKPDT